MKLIAAQSQMTLRALNQANMTNLVLVMEAMGTMDWELALLLFLQ